MARPGNPNITKVSKKTQFKAGNKGGGRPQGVKNWANILQDLMADEDFANKVINKKPSWWTNLPNKNLANVIGAAMLLKAAGGDDKAAKWVRETAFGNKIIHDFDESIFSTGASVSINIQAAKELLTADETAEDTANTQSPASEGVGAVS